jgi:hypothetical protein
LKRLQHFKRKEGALPSINQGQGLYKIEALDCLSTTKDEKLSDERKMKLLDIGFEFIREEEYTDVRRKEENGGQRCQVEQNA